MGDNVTNSEFERIYQLYFEGVFLYVLKLTKNQHIAEEITSDTFFKAMNSIDKFQGNCEMNSWLCQIAKNTYYSYVRKNRVIDYNYEMDKKEDINSVCIEEYITSNDAVMHIHKVLHLLEEPYKEVFMLRVFSELSFKQIAKIFKKSDNWACVTFYRAKKKIQAEMEEY